MFGEQFALKLYVHNARTLVVVELILPTGHKLFKLLKLCQDLQTKTQAVKPVVVSLNPGLVNFLSDVEQKSMRHPSCVIHLVYVEKQPVAWEVCCVEYWCEKTRKYVSM